MLNTLQLALTEDRVICQHVSAAISTAERVRQSSDAISRFRSALRGPSFPSVRMKSVMMGVYTILLCCVWEGDETLV